MNSPIHLINVPTCDDHPQSMFSRQNIDGQTGGVWYSATQPTRYYGRLHSSSIRTLSGSFCFELRADRTASPCRQAACGQRTRFNLQHGAHPSRGARSMAEEECHTRQSTASVRSLARMIPARSAGLVQIFIESRRPKSIVSVQSSDAAGAGHHAAPS